jgi:hypothetical protein
LIVQEIALTIQARVDELDDIHGYFFRLHGSGSSAPTEQAAVEAK